MQNIKYFKPKSVKTLNNKAMFYISQGLQPKQKGNIVSVQRIFDNKTITTTNNVLVVDKNNDVKAKNYCALNIENLVNTKDKHSFIITTFGDKISTCTTSILLKNNYDLIEIDLDNPSKSIGVNFFKNIISNYKKANSSQPVLKKYYQNLTLNLVDNIFEVNSNNEEKASNFLKAVFLGILEDKKSSINSFSIQNIYNLIKLNLIVKDEDVLKKLFKDKSELCKSLSLPLLKSNPKRRQFLMEIILDKLKHYLTASYKKLYSTSMMNIKFINEIPTCFIIKLSEKTKNANAYAPLLLEYLLAEININNKIMSFDKRRDYYVMLDDLDRQPKYYDLNFKIDSCRINNIKFCATITDQQLLEHIYAKQTKQIINNFEIQLLFKDTTSTEPLTIAVKQSKPINKYHLSQDKIKLYKLDLSCIDSNEAILLQENKQPIKVNFDFYC